MSTWAILASGPSMTPAIVELVRLKGWNTCVVNNTYLMMPDADVLFAADRQWWAAHPEALAFGGRKCVCELPAPKGTTYVRPRNVPIGGNSALRAAHMLETEGAERIVLFGIDLDERAARKHWHDEHRFRSTSAGSFSRARTAWNQYAKQVEIPVLNANPNSKLTCFPIVEADTL